MNRTHRRFAAIAGFAVFVLSIPAVSQADGPPPAPQPVPETLQMRLAVTDQADPAKPQFRVEFVNSGDHDLTMHLGIVLGNGNAHFPLAIRLKETGPDGETRELQIPGPPIAGRVDYFLVPLPAGATYSLRLNLSDFRRKGNWERLELFPGNHRFTAELKGPAKFDGVGSASDKGVRIRNPWTGHVQSNEVSLRR